MPTPELNDTTRTYYFRGDDVPVVWTGDDPWKPPTFRVQVNCVTVTRYPDGDVTCDVTGFRLTKKGERDSRYSGPVRVWDHEALGSVLALVPVEEREAR